MTCNEVYTMALSLLPSNSTENDELRQYIPAWINLAMRETIETENGLRRFNNDPRGILEAPPKISGMDEVIPYSYELSEYAFPYYLASIMCKDDDDSYWAQDYRTRFIVAVGEANRYISGKVEDVYGGECE